MRLALKVLLGSLAVFGAVGAGLALGRQPEPFPPGSRSAALLEDGPLPVQRYEETFVDRSRRTDANGDFPGAPERTLPAWVWYPDSPDGAPFPLIVYSHGFSSMREEGARMARHLAQVGFVVVAAEFPLTSLRAPGGPELRDVVHQPGDVSFLIDRLLAQSRDPGHRLSGRVDPGRIGAVGVSLGGLTTTLAAFHPEFGDGRIRAALSIAGPSEMFTEVFFRHRQVPFLMLATDTDALVPYPENAAPVLEKVPGSQRVTIRNGSHAGFAEPAAMLRWLRNPDVVGCWAVLRNVDPDEMAAGRWHEQLGTQAQGVDVDTDLRPCQADPLPAAMNPLRQQMIARVVVRSFFESCFARDASRRRAAQTYLSQTLAAEIPEVEYAASERRHP